MTSLLELVVQMLELGYIAAKRGKLFTLVGFPAAD
jgi:hypothetical protein